MAKNEAAVKPITDESISLLDQVKKGKPKKFAMICKGTSVISLVIYKKGSVEKRRKEAKESGKGQFYFGVVDGSGLDIRFVLARSDGFESEPVKNAVLKSFLDESADFKCKPFFEIVDSPLLVLDEDDPLVARYRALRTVADGVVQSDPVRGPELKALFAQIEGHLDRDETVDAISRLDQLEKLLVGGETNVQQDASAPPPPAPPQPTDPSEATRFNERLKGLLPLVKAAVGTPPGDQAKTLVGQAAAKAKQQVFTEAHQLLDQAQALLEQKTTEVGSQGQASPAAATDSSSAFNERLKALLPAVKAAAGTPPGEEAKALVGQAVAQAKSQQWAAAMQMLDQVESLLKEANPSSTSPPTTASEASETPAEEFKAKLLAFRPIFAEVIKVARQSDAALADELDGLFARMAECAKSKNFLEASGILDSLNERIDDAFDIQIEEEDSEEQESEARGDRNKERGIQPPTPPAELRGMELWKWQRAEALKSLEQLEAAFRQTDHPEKDAGIILLKAIHANLTEEPTALSQIDELQRYLETDDVIEAAETPNAFGFVVRLRQPLLHALDSLRQELSKEESK